MFVTSLGDIQQAKDATQAISYAGTAASITAGVVGASSVVPVIGWAVAGGTLLIALFSKLFAGCGASCVQATSIVNQIENGPLNPPMLPLKQALAMFKAGQISQADALANFDAAWAAVVNGCGQIGGQGGQGCIADRQRGGKWDWFAMYRDPIADAPSVSSSSFLGGGSSAAELPQGSWLGLAAGLVLLAVGLSLK